MDFILLLFFWVSKIMDSLVLLENEALRKPSLIDYARAALLYLQFYLDLQYYEYIKDPSTNYLGIPF